MCRVKLWTDGVEFKRLHSFCRCMRMRLLNMLNSHAIKELIEALCLIENEMFFKVTKNCF